MSISIAVDDFDEITKNLQQVSALLWLIIGEGMEAFDNCSDEIRSNYLWSCADHVDRAIALIELPIDITKKK